MSFRASNGKVLFRPEDYWERGDAHPAQLPIAQLPHQIAVTSRCVCGDPLALTDHSIIQEDDIVDFKAIFACEWCNAKISAKMKRFFGTVWGKTRKLEAGVTGVKYEKEGET